MNSDMTPSEFCFLLIVLILFWIVGVSSGGHLAEKSIRRQAIEAGVARYEVDAKTGKTKFIFIKP